MSRPDEGSAFASRPVGILLRSTVFQRTLALVLLLAGVAAAVIGIVGWHANTVLTRATSAAIDTDIRELRHELGTRGLDGLAQAVTDRSAARGTALYRLEDESGRIRAGNLAALPSAFEGGGKRSGTFRYVPVAPDELGRRIAAGVLIDIDGQATLVVARDIEDQRTLLLAIYRSIGLGAGLLALLGLGGGLFLSRHVLGRIEQMGAASAAIMGGDLTGRIPLDGSGDELDRLAARLNEMLGRIERLMTGLREVSDNIAHDLRTPLNRLRNRAEAALGDTRGATAWRDGLERVIEEADEIIKTFNALLLIARLEAGSAPERLEVLDLAAVAHDIAELYEPVAEESGFALECHAEERLHVAANRQLVGQVITNLIDNALKYGRRATGVDAARREIRIEVRPEGRFAAVIVADRGPGIPAPDRQRALKRFVRLEESRSEPGTGLGLSLVAAVARLHGGAVRLEDNQPGLRVVLTLPLASAPAVMPSSAGAAAKETTEA
ncbi:MAG: HAMP domain-containing sensor histidine kinase [Hyphomicrobiaceae bacterium]|nr:HAMP domain-containing sensor histidine kinase [Hyphomicrobiaceae bacterium]